MVECWVHPSARFWKTKSGRVGREEKKDRQILEALKSPAIISLLEGLPSFTRNPAVSFDMYKSGTTQQERDHFRHIKLSLRPRVLPHDFK